MIIFNKHILPVIVLYWTTFAQGSGNWNLVSDVIKTCIHRIFKILQKSTTVTPAI